MERIIIPSGNHSLEGVVHLAEKGAKPYIFLMCHGFRGSKDGGGRAVDLAELARDEGYTTVRFDFTPLAPLSQQIRELSDVLTYIRERFGLPIIGMGRSMGGCAIALSVRQAKDIVGFCFWATPNDLPKTMRRALGSYYDELMTYGRIEATDEYGHIVLEKSFWDELADYDMSRAMQAITRPTIFVQGSEDELVMAEEAQANYDACQGEKEWYLVSGADHHIALDVENTQAKIIAWMREHFSA